MATVCSPNAYCNKTNQVLKIHCPSINHCNNSLLAPLVISILISKHTAKLYLKKDSPSNGVSLLSFTETVFESIIYNGFLNPFPLLLS